MQSLARLLRFIGFTLLEYMRSGRILIELVAGLIFFYIFLTKRNGSPLEAEQLFSTTGLFTLALTLYTMSALLGLADRPQGYLLLTRKLGRATYLLGFYFAALVVVWGTYGVISLLVALTNRPEGLTLVEWLLGTLPLLLNVALLAALLLMLSSLVFSAGLRLMVLALIALAFSGNLINGPLLQQLPDWLRGLLAAVQALLSGPLVPAFSGFALSVSRDYSSSNGFVTVLAQASLVVALLGLSIYAFARRELIFSGG